MSRTQRASARRMVAGQLAELAGIGRDRRGGYRRFAWTNADVAMREWFTEQADALGLAVEEDAATNLWAWWGDPDATGPGVVVGSHLDSVPCGGAYDGPLGLISAFTAIELLQAGSWRPPTPIGVVAFTDQEGARFGQPCVGSRLLTGRLDPNTLLRLRDQDGDAMSDVLVRSGRRPYRLQADPGAAARIGVFIELHIEQSDALARLNAPVGVGAMLWPHGRWRFDLRGQGNHAGTSAMLERDDPMIDLARLILTAREVAIDTETVATIGLVEAQPAGINVIPAHVTAWLDARAESEPALLAAVRRIAESSSAALSTESLLPGVEFEPALVATLSQLLGEEDRPAPVLTSGAGCDAGILAMAGIPTAMLYVRNPTGISHAPEEHIDDDDCGAGAQALATVIMERAAVLAAARLGAGGP